MSGTAGTQGECRAEKETEEEIIQRCISHLDTDYSCRLAKQMEREKTNPVLGFRTAGSHAEKATGDFLYEEMRSIGLTEVQKEEFWLDSWTFERAVLRFKDSSGKEYTCQLGAYQTNFETDGFQEYELVYVGRGTAADYKNLDVRGKLVLADINQRDEWWINYPVYQAYLKGVASLQYQLNETIYETRTQEGTIARNIIRTPSSDTDVETVRTDAEGLIYATEGTTVLQQYPYSFTVRSDSGKSLTGVQKFTITGDRSGQRIQVIPIAEADSVAGKIYSLHELDEKNKITLIADGEPPVIYGMEMLENRELIDRRDGKVNVTITASDAVSGVKEFYVNIQNTDNTVSKTYHPDADGSIRMEITEDDALFSGDFTVFAYACDQVGNETEISEGTTEFGLEADIIRIREPQDAAFRCGESGILTFTVWGYADRVEVIFPKEMTDLCPELNRIFDYRDKPGYRITEQLQFMVPLYTPENENFEVTVKAYKGDKKLEDHPGISVIGVKGSVLEDLRTRLR